MSELWWKIQGENWFLCLSDFETHRLTDALVRSQIDKLRIHLKYFCGEGAVRTEAQARQRRNEDNGGRQVGRGGSGGAGNNSSKSPKGASEKKKIAHKRMGHIADYDSESELSYLSSKVMSSARRSRKASVVAKAKMFSSKKEWSIEKNDDSEEYEVAGVSSSEDSTHFEAASLKKIPAQARGKKPLKRTPLAEDDDDDSDSADFAPQTKSSKTTAKGGSGKAKKKLPIKKGAKQLAVKKTGKKKDGESDDDESDDANPVDPMDGIDMDLLMKEAMDGSTMSLLHSLCWWRIVLDEAHFIKSRSSQTANAAFALIAVNRWCLSGTPLQNRVGEFYSLIRFLRIDPMAHYFCRAKVCHQYRSSF